MDLGMSDHKSKNKKQVFSQSKNEQKKTQRKIINYPDNKFLAKTADNKTIIPLSIQAYESIKSDVKTPQQENKHNEDMILYAKDWLQIHKVP